MANQLLPNRHILYVEDDDFLANLIAKKLDLEGALVVHASNPEIAMDKMRENKFDALLLDLLLPEMSGLDLVERLGEEFDLTNIPVVIFSNLAVDEDIDRAKTLGVDRYLIKANVVPEEITGVLAEVIEEYKSKSDKEDTTEEKTVPEEQVDTKKLEE